MGRLGAVGRVFQAFYERYHSHLRTTTAVAEVFLVPTLLLNVIGQVQLAPLLKSWVVVPLAFADTVGLAIFLVTSIAGPKTPTICCPECTGRMVPDTIAWTCRDCSRRWVRPDPPSARS